MAIDRILRPYSDSAQLRLNYLTDTSKYVDVGSDSSGRLFVTPVGSGFTLTGAGAVSGITTLASTDAISVTKAGTHTGTSADLLVLYSSDGTNVADAALRISVATQDWRIGIDNSNADALVIGQGGGWDGAGAVVTMTPAGAVTFASDATIGGDLIITNSSTPASAAATGTAGTIAWDSSYIYVCTAANTWKRVAIATW